MQQNIQHFFDPQTSTFSYLVYQGLGSSAIIIDSVLNYDHRSGRTHTQCADQLIVFVKEQQLRVVWILETHAHADHLSAAPYLKKHLGGQIVIGKNISQIQGVFKNIFHLEDDFAVDGSQFDYLIADQEKLAFGNLTLQVNAKLQAEIEPIYDLVLLTCKAFDLPSAINSIRPAINGKTAILPLLNGLAHMDALNNAFGNKNVLGGTAKMQVTLTPTGIVKQINDWQTITFGEQDGKDSIRTNELLSMFSKTSIEAKISQNITRDMWLKIVHLATVAGMTCLMRANIGEIVRTPEGSEFLKKFLNEQGKILPRRLTGTSLKFQRKVAQAVKRSRHIALIPYVTDLMK